MILFGFAIVFVGFVGFYCVYVSFQLCNVQHLKNLFLDFLTISGFCL